MADPAGNNKSTTKAAAGAGDGGDDETIISRPKGTTMEGMIWNANHVLEQALKPDVNGLPKWLFETAVGVVILHSVQVGFLVSGQVGTGIVLRRTSPRGGDWSPPCAVGLSGIGMGLQAGLSAKDLVVFVLDDPTMKSLTSKHGLGLGAQYELTVGPFGRAASASTDLTTKGVGTAITIGYSQGAFAGVSLAGAIVGTRDAANHKFYNNDSVTATDILYGGDVGGAAAVSVVTIPTDRVTLLDEVYDKLNKLQEGATIFKAPVDGQPPINPEEEEKKRAAKEVAIKAEAIHMQGRNF